MGLNVIKSTLILQYKIQIINSYYHITDYFTKHSKWLEFLCHRYVAGLQEQHNPDKLLYNDFLGRFLLHTLNTSSPVRAKCLVPKSCKNRIIL